MEVPLRLFRSTVTRRSAVRTLRGQYRYFTCPAQQNGAGSDLGRHAAEDIMNMAANKATRFVYLRTLPLVKQPEVESEVELVASRIENMTRSICEKHAGGLIDDRSAVHLHTTALAIATHRVLSPRIRNEIRLSNVIRSGFGAALLPDPSSGELADTQATDMTRPDFWIVRAALWFSFDRMASIRKMTANMVRDFGGAFHTHARDADVDGAKTHELIVTKCFYNDLCRKEGLPHLTKIFCALDKAIYSPITRASHGIDFDLERTLADETTDTEGAPPSCSFRFAAAKKG